MAGPNLEVFKFGLYLFFPLAVMIHYGDPEWYQRHVLPFRDEFWPKESTLFKPPRTSEGVKSTIEELRNERLAKRNARSSENGQLIEASKNSPKGLTTKQSQQEGIWDRIDAARQV
ncbi:unnamed protein product [Sympodiomycopsis kandeliae]